MFAVSQFLFLGLFDSRFSSAVKAIAAFPSPDTDLRIRKKGMVWKNGFFPRSTFLQVSDYEKAM